MDELWCLYVSVCGSYETSFWIPLLQIPNLVQIYLIGFYEEREFALYVSSISNELRIPVRFVSCPDDVCFCGVGLGALGRSQSLAIDRVSPILGTCERISLTGQLEGSTALEITSWKTVR